MKKCTSLRSVQLLQDLQKAVTHVKLNPKEKIEGNAAVYGAMSTIPGERASLDEDENTCDESTPAKWLQT